MACEHLRVHLPSPGGRAHSVTGLHYCLMGAPWQVWTVRSLELRGRGNHENRQSWSSHRSLANDVRYLGMKQTGAYFIWISRDDKTTTKIGMQPCEDAGCADLFLYRAQHLPLHRHTGRAFMNSWVSHHTCLKGAAGLLIISNI